MQVDKERRTWRRPKGGAGLRAEGAQRPITIDEEAFRREETR